MKIMSSDTEEYLIDDDISCQRLVGGTLAFVSESGDNLNSLATVVGNTGDSNGIDDASLDVRTNRPGPLGVRFEIIDAQIKEDENGKFVVYTILIIRSAGVDNVPAKINRRYSDMSRLHATLRKTFPSLMRDVRLPPKQLRGNYKPETIARRSRAFEQYLGHVFSIDAIRQSEELCDFFYGGELREGYRYIENGDYSGAVALLRPTWRLQTKLVGDTDVSSIATLCAVVSSCAANEDDLMACSHAERALECIGSSSDRHLVPLLRLVIRLCWKLGRSKYHYELRLQDLRNRGLEIDDSPSLLELVVNRFR